MNRFERMRALVEAASLANAAVEELSATKALVTVCFKDRDIDESVLTVLDALCREHDALVSVREAIKQLALDVASRMEGAR